MSDNVAHGTRATGAAVEPRQVDASEHTARGAVWAVAFAGFTLVTAVTYPVGVLPQIAADLDTSAGNAGLTITVSALVTGLTAALLGVSARVVDRRLVLVAAVAVAAIGNLLAAIAPSLLVLLVARVGVGVGSGAFWGIAAGVAPHLVPDSRVPRATAVIFGSASAAAALGVPSTAALGTSLGWRAGALALAALAAIGTAGLLWFLPVMTPPSRRPRAQDHRRRSSFRATSGVLLVAILVVVGHFAAFTFARPALEQISGVPTSVVPPLLAGFGGAGVLGAALAGRHAGARPQRAAQMIAATMAAAVAAICLLPGEPVAAAALLCAWGAGYGALGATLPLWIRASAGEDHDRASAVYIAVFNGSIALGAALGGLVVDATGSQPRMATPLVVASCLIALGVVTSQFASTGGGRR
jgi:predicted MFS family arabinose efflux permease